MAKIVEPSEWEVAGEVLKTGGLVAFATDTVYGISCRYDFEESQMKLKNAKARPEEKSLPILVGSLEQCEEIAELDERSRKIILHFLPGALTLILKKKDSIPPWVTNGKDTVAIRMIQDEVIDKLIRMCGVPLFLTSANLSQEPVCQDAFEVNERLGERIDVIIDGKHHDSLASTILDCTQEHLIVRREGPIKLEEIYTTMEEER